MFTLVLADFSGLHVLTATYGREDLNVAGCCGNAVNVLLTDIACPPKWTVWGWRRRWKGCSQA